MNDGGAVVGGILLLLLGAAVYFLPAIVSMGRDHKNSVSITVLNLFLGWTLIGWVGALVWAFSDNVESDLGTQDPTISPGLVQKKETKNCPFCAEEIRIEAVKCKHCGSELSASTA